MIVYDLKQFALGLKKELDKDSAVQSAKMIGLKIKNATHPNGTPLTETEKKHIVNYIAYPGYDPKTGTHIVLNSDNSAFLKLVAVISQTASGGK